MRNLLYNCSMREELRYYIHTYGCQMNVHDSEKIAGILQAYGYLPCDDEESADIIVLNTCCIRETAESKVYGNIGELKHIKEKKPSAIIAVCGCMTQQEAVANKILRSYPYVDIVIGTHNAHKIGEYVQSRMQGGKRVVDVWDSEGEIYEGAPVKRSDRINAWVNITYGCNNFCSYCIVPYVRGRERSRDFDAIIAEVRSLVDSGYKEITLLGQNVNSYLYKGKTFPDLLRALDFDDKRYRLKFMTSHPKDFSEPLANEIARSRCLAKYIHLPLQAGSDRVLKLMNRHYDSAQYLDKIRLLRSTVEGVGISSDIMVGFPTETREDFLDTLNMVKKVQYNNLFTFVYSRRRGTPADTMEQVDDREKHERIKELIALQFDIGCKIAESYIGKEFEVLCDEWGDGKGYGKAQNDVGVVFSSTENVTGEFVKVKISSSKNSNLFGELV